MRNRVAWKSKVAKKPRVPVPSPDFYLASIEFARAVGAASKALSEAMHTYTETIKKLTGAV